MGNYNILLERFLGSEYLQFGTKFDVRRSGFFLLTPSPWPLFSSFAVFLMLTGFAAYMNYYVNGLFLFFVGCIVCHFCIFFLM